MTDPKDKMHDVGMDNLNGTNHWNTGNFYHHQPSLTYPPSHSVPINNEIVK